MADWNAGIIEEFRANAGVVGGVFDGKPLLIVEHAGAKTGTVRHSPLVYQDLGSGSYAIFASKGGAPDNPDWLHNLKANPDTSIEIGDRTENVRARVAEGAERTPIWEKQKAEMPQFAEYEAKTDREIPVVVLDPR